VIHSACIQNLATLTSAVRRYDCRRPNWKWVTWPRPF